MAKTNIKAQVLETLDDINKKLETIDKRLTILEEKKLVEERIQVIRKLQNQKQFPYIYEYSLTWHRLLNATNDEFNRYVRHSLRLYDNTPNVLNKINRRYYIGDKRDVTDVIMLDETQFENFCINIIKYRMVSFVESLSNSDWIMFFAQDETSFTLSYRNTKKIDKAICNHTIKKPTLKEWRIFAWLPAREFEKTLDVWKQEYPTYLINKEGESRLEKEAGEMIAKVQKKNIRQCLGNCSTCMRETCVLDSNLK